jgi:autotransporter-associated beta strand protein
MPAASATWSASPASNDWNTAANWTPATVPNGANDIASFGVSNNPSVKIAADTSVKGINFNPQAPTYTIDSGDEVLMIGSNGIHNNSGTTQYFSGIVFVDQAIFSVGTPLEFTSGRAEFHLSSSAGNANFTGGMISFIQQTTAGNATFSGANVVFSGDSSAGNATITGLGGATNGASGRLVEFQQFASAGNAMIVCQGGNAPGAQGATLHFWFNPKAPNATLIVNGGTNGGSGASIVIDANNFFDGGNSRAIVNAGATCYMNVTSQHGAVTMGSIEGAGDFFLGPTVNDNFAIVGANNSSTVVSGVIQNNGSASGRLKKVGTGTLTLTNSNTYSGGTFIDAGRLEALHSGALGTGDVFVTNAGATLTLNDTSATDGAIASSAALSIVSGCTVNLNFSGARRIAALVVDGVVQPFGTYGAVGGSAPNPLPQFAGNGTLQITGPAAVSRKGGGDFFLPLGGFFAIEPRSGGANNSYQIVVSYRDPVTFNSASVTSGTGMVTSAVGNGTPTITIDLAGLINAKKLTVTLFGVNDGKTVRDIPIRFGVLVGDATGNGQVNSSDVAFTKAQSGKPVSAANLGADVNGNGSINASDVALVKSKSGTNFQFRPDGTLLRGLSDKAGQSFQN